MTSYRLIKSIHLNSNKWIYLTYKVYVNVKQLEVHLLQQCYKFKYINVNKRTYIPTHKHIVYYF